MPNCRLNRARTCFVCGEFQDPGYNLDARIYSEEDHRIDPDHRDRTLCVNCTPGFERWLGAKLLDMQDLCNVDDFAHDLPTFAKQFKKEYQKNWHESGGPLHLNRAGRTFTDWFTGRFPRV